MVSECSSLGTGLPASFVVYFSVISVPSGGALVRAGGALVRADQGSANLVCPFGVRIALPCHRRSAGRWRQRLVELWHPQQAAVERFRNSHHQMPEQPKHFGSLRCAVRPAAGAGSSEYRDACSRRSFVVRILREEDDAGGEHFTAAFDDLWSYAVNRPRCGLGCDHDSRIPVRARHVVNAAAQPRHPPAPLCVYRPPAKSRDLGCARTQSCKIVRLQGCRVGDDVSNRSRNERYGGARRRRTGGDASRRRRG